MKIGIISICLLLFGQSYSQTTNNQEIIKNSIETYFAEERENIHVQFNKNIYVNNEDIAFKGYVLSKNNNTPQKYTTNVQLVIYDAQDQIVQKQLLYTENGSFTGGLHLSDKFKSGNYYFHFYTNWMNNFNEDDSFTQTIEIINPKEPYQINTNEPNWKTVKIDFFPESGTIINEINNTVGVKITDCNQKGIEIKEAILTDSKQNEIATFNTNKMGNGVFYFVPNRNETYTVKIKNEKLTLSQILPAVAETGIIISYNNNLPKNILAVAIKTNDKGLELYKDKKMIVLIHQNNRSVQKEIILTTENEKTLLIDKKYLSNGVNIIRLLDQNLNQLAERLLYHYAENKAVMSLEAKAIANDSIILTGKSDFKKPNLSLSILPEENICITKKGCILGTYYLNAYLENPVVDSYSYFDPANTSKKQEMELLMLNQNKSKYKWENIKNNPPKATYKFNKGVTIEGKVDRNISNKADYKISLINLKDNVFEEASIDEKNEFKFKNFYARDSTLFLLQLINKNNSTKYTEIEAKVTPNETSFLLPHHFEKANCPVEKKPENIFVFTAVKEKNNIVNLDELVINTVKQPILKHENDMSLNASAYKMGENEFGSVLDFIGRHGYKTGVSSEDGSAYIKDSRDAFSATTSSPPSVYIDNQMLFDINILFSIDLSQVDEIYIDKSGFSDMGIGGSGTIKIFMKEGGKNSFYRTKYTSLIVTTGFTQNINFKNATFETQKEFFYFGTLNWIPFLTTNDKNTFVIKSSRGNQKEIQVLVEGFTAEGNLISEIQKIKVQE